MYEVTNDRYDACVHAGVCQRTNGACQSSRGHARPASCLTATEAEVVCGFEGKRLPSQDEWERAARGVVNATRPVGFTNDTMQLGIHDVGDSEADSTSLPFKIFDVAGNVSEWTSTTIGTKRVVSGGSFLWTMPNLPRAVRTFDVTIRSDDIGVRCAKSVMPRAVMNGQ